MDKLACLTAFVTVVESGGFSETARRLNVSKALVSKKVAQLEDELGVRLLNRTTRRISPTSSGQAYYEQCRPLLNELNELDDSVKSSDKTLQGELRLSAPTTFAELHLLSVVSSYTAEHPEVKVTLDLTDRFLNLVEERIDLAIRIGKLEDSSLVSRRIGEIRLLVCASPKYLAKRGTPETLAELSGHCCIIDSNNDFGKNWSIRLGNVFESVTVNDRITVNNARVACDLVVLGDGVGLLPSFVAEDYLKKGKLVSLFGDEVGDPIGIYAVYLHRKHLSPKVRVMMDFLVKEFGSNFR